MPSERSHKRAFIVNHNLSLAGALSNSEELSRATAGNLGNSLIADAFLRDIGQERISGIRSLANLDFSSVNLDPGWIREHHDVLVIMFQDHIRPNSAEYRFEFEIDYSGLSNFIASVGLPIVVPSLGVNFHEQKLADFLESLDDELVSFLRELSAKTPSIGVRGATTAEVLGHFGIQNSTIIGCPSYYSNGETFPEKANGFGGLQRTNCEPRVAFTSDLLIRKKPANRNQKNIPIVLQSEFDLIDMVLFGGSASSPRAIALEGKRNSKLLRAFPDPQEWVEFYRDFDFAVGSRFHGAMAAHAAGTAHLVLSDDQRTAELSEHLRLFRRPSIERKSSIDELFQEACSYRESVSKPAYTSLYPAYMSFLGEHSLGQTFRFEGAFVSDLQDEQSSTDVDGQLFFRADSNHLSRAANFLIGKASRIRRRLLFVE